MGNKIILLALLMTGCSKNTVFYKDAVVDQGLTNYSLSEINSLIDNDHLECAKYYRPNNLKADFDESYYIKKGKTAKVTFFNERGQQVDYVRINDSDCEHKGR